MIQDTSPSRAILNIQNIEKVISRHCNKQQRSSIDTPKSIDIWTLITSKIRDTVEWHSLFGYDFLVNFSIGMSGR